MTYSESPFSQLSDELWHVFGGRRRFPTTRDEIPGGGTASARRSRTGRPVRVLREAGRRQHVPPGGRDKSLRWPGADPGGGGRWVRRPPPPGTEGPAPRARVPSSQWHKKGHWCPLNGCSWQTPFKHNMAINIWKSCKSVFAFVKNRSSPSHIRSSLPRRPPLAEILDPCLVAPPMRGTKSLICTASNGTTGSTTTTAGSAKRLMSSEKAARRTVVCSSIHAQGHVQSSAGRRRSLLWPTWRDSSWPGAAASARRGRGEHLRGHSRQKIAAARRQLI